MAFSAANGNIEIQGHLARANEQEILNAVLGLVRDRLPRSWRVDLARAGGSRAGDVDATVRILAPDGNSVTILVESKRLLAMRDVGAALDQLQRFQRLLAEPRILPMVVARYIAPTVRERLAKSGAAYGDATGNIRIEWDRPALFVYTTGADRDPWRGPGRPRGGLKGAPAGRVVRALVDYRPPYRVLELAANARASAGATYRVVDFAADEGLLEREPRGPISDVRWRALLERWSHDYSFTSSNTVGTYLEPRGLDALIERLRSTDVDYVVTGSLAAHRHAPYAPARAAMVYVDDVDHAARALELRPVDRGANVLLASGQEFVFARSEEAGGIRWAAPSQAAVDLLGGPGRNPAEGEALLDWMEAHEHEWRH